MTTQYDVAITLIIPNPFDVSDLAAIEAWQAALTEGADVSLLPNGVYMWTASNWAAVVDGKLVAKDLPYGPACVAYSTAVKAYLEAMPFDGSYQVESEE